MLRRTETARAHGVANGPLGLCNYDEDDDITVCNSTQLGENSLKLSPF